MSASRQLIRQNLGFAAAVFQPFNNNWTLFSQECNQMNYVPN